MAVSLEPIDRYQPIEVLGAGSFGTVFRARHAHTGEIVALKVLHEPSRELSERVLREARALAGLVHPNVVRVLDCGMGARGQIFVAMELAHGVPLIQWLSGPLPALRAIDLTRQLLAGLAVVHARGVVHRDIKPSNIVVESQPSPVPGGPPIDRLRLIDFGISRLADPTLPSSSEARTQPGTSMGTPGYMAPEQLGHAHVADGRADLYAVAVILYQMLSGRLPHPAPSYEDYVVSVRTSVPPPLTVIAPQVWGPLEAAVMKGLAREPQHRYVSADEFSRALEQAARDPRAGSLAPTMPAPMPMPMTPAAMGARGASGSMSGPTPPAVVHSQVQKSSALPILGIVGGLLSAMVIGGVTVWYFATGRGAANEKPPESAAPSVWPAPSAAWAKPSASWWPTPAASAKAPGAPAGAAAPANVPAQGAAAAPTGAAARATAAPEATAKAPCGHPGTLSVAIGSAPGVKIGSGSVVGRADPAWMDQVARAGATAAGACRPQCGQELVKVSLFLQPTGGITLAQPANDNAGDPAVASCVATRLKAAAPPHDPKFPSSPTGAPGGIVTFAALLEQK